MAYHVAPSYDKLPSPDQVPVGGFALVAGEDWYKNGALGRGWLKLDHTPRPYADEEIEWEEDEEEIDWEDV